MNRRAFMGGFIGATVAPVLPVAVALVPRRFGMSEIARVYSVSEAELDGSELSFTLHYDD